MREIERHLIEQEPNLLYLVLSGSRVYGTNLPDSDYDYRGIFANTEREVIGLETRDAQTYDGEDITLHGLTKFLNLALNANPNVVELLFIDEFAISIHPLFQKYFLDHRDMFLTEKCYYTYSGYAMSQVQKSKHKSSHGTLREKYIHGTEEDPYDSKYAMHTVRLMLNGLEILTQGTLHPHFDGEQLDLLTEIRSGRFFKTATEFYEFVTDLDERMKIERDKVKSTKFLPHHPDRNFFSEQLVKFYKEYFGYVK